MYLPQSNKSPIFLHLLDDADCALHYIVTLRDKAFPSQVGMTVIQEEGRLFYIEVEGPH